MTDINPQEKVIEQPNSTEISINAKGQWSGKVKSYAGSLLEAYNITVDKAKSLALLIKEKNAGKS